MKQKIKKILVLFVFMGCMYLLAEVFYTAIVGALSRELKDIKYWSLIGKTSLWLFFVGGFLGVFLGLFNEIKILKTIRPIFCWLLGTASVVLVELFSGLILNKVFKLNIWDYSSFAFNLWGQICLFYSLFWLVITPFVFWVDDFLRFVLFKEKKKRRKEWSRKNKI